jgi:regulator of replication initiation timing
MEQTIKNLKAQLDDLKRRLRESENLNLGLIAENNKLNSILLTRENNDKDATS